MSRDGDGQGHFELRVVTEISAAHVLRGYAGACERVHGHNFKVEVEVHGRSLDDVGMAIDFYELERMTQEILAPFDHRLLNDVPPFSEVNPTAENIARHVFEALAEALGARTGDPPAVFVRAVTVRENDRYAVRYVEDDGDRRAAGARSGD
jgi:6-pyruvoyltetrahydropterin/6-carboxytetrahydropterin synthase